MNTGVSWASGSVGAGRVPEAVSPVSSVTEAAAAATEGASSVPLTVMVRVLEPVPPCPSLTVQVKVSVRVSPTPRACTAGRALLRVYVYEPSARSVSVP